ncbi:MSMEG_0570 family nitrogen starvation response protein [Modestobacter roseus]|uniref:Putative repeat protein (TIGR04042 family) n=1 Tax=Modestobacter roseus TaxID=1181884 RepID=A0A562IWL6_9ACTN|nr:MSMEG_0570 family nitrogen starvation response protein [Modestobacter roseus]MQA34036.1 MSMEG_0570 family nitrogen starvation response protein [Modestobacter roseus]TWH75399.1 putative repeat protein (TIGR04042 family) [Modestobacter roseus]
MPEVEFDVQWPDGDHQQVYSPSTVVEEVFDVGTGYPLHRFLALSRAAMAEASHRVEARWGFPCSRAAATLTSIERAAARFDGGEVRVTGFRRIG